MKRDRDGAVAVSAVEQTGSGAGWISKERVLYAQRALGAVTTTPRRRCTRAVMSTKKRARAQWRCGQRLRKGIGRQGTRQGTRRPFQGELAMELALWDGDKNKSRVEVCN